MKLKLSDLLTAQIDSMLQGQSVHQIRIALTQILNRGLEGYVPVVLRLCDHPEAIVRGQALWSLMKLGGAEHLALYRAKLKDNDPLVRRSAIEGVEAYGDVSDLEELEPMRHDGDKLVRDAAVRACEELVKDRRGRLDGVIGS